MVRTFGPDFVCKDTNFYHYEDEPVHSTRTASALLAVILRNHRAIRATAVPGRYLQQAGACCRGGSDLLKR